MVTLLLPKPQLFKTWLWPGQTSDLPCAHCLGLWLMFPEPSSARHGRRCVGEGARGLVQWAGGTAVAVWERVPVGWCSGQGVAWCRGGRQAYSRCWCPWRAVHGRCGNTGLVHVA